MLGNINTIVHKNLFVQIAKVATGEDYDKTPSDCNNNQRYDCNNYQIVVGELRAGWKISKYTIFKNKN